MFKNIKKIKRNGGFTYVELIVVLSIFAVMTSILMFNYGAFQSKIDVKVLANDIALKIVQAQHDAMNGKLIYNKSFGGAGKPSYGVAFDTSNKTNSASFIYYADIDNSGSYSDSFSSCLTTGTDQCLEKINISKGDYVSKISLSTDGTATGCTPSTSLSINFTRPSSSAKLTATGVVNTVFADIKIATPQGDSSVIRMDPSGRVSFPATTDVVCK